MAAPLTGRALHKQRTRQRVLAEARRIFARDGFEGLSIRSVAQAVGMSTGAVMNNFPTKADLWAAAMDGEASAGALAFATKIARTDVSNLAVGGPAAVALWALVEEARAIVGQAALRDAAA